MKKTILAALIAATALVPPVLAQDRGRGDNRGGRNSGGQAQSAPQARQDRGNWQQRQSQPDARREARAQARPERPAREQGQPRAERQQRWEGNRGQQARPQTQPVRPVQQARPDQRPGRPDQNWRGNNRGTDDRSRWNGNNRQPSRGILNNRGNDRNWNGTVNRNDRNWGDRNNRNWNDRNNRNWDNRGWRSNNRYDWRGYRNDNRSAFRLPRYYAPRGYAYGYNRFSIGYTLNTLLFSSQYWINDPYNYRLPEAYGPYRWVRYYNDALLVDIDTGEVVDTIYDIFW